jgi:DNA-directed RNA polymerase subunit RPC12/RpoP
MTDIFDAKISCRKCGKEMEDDSMIRSGFKLRAVKCLMCGDKIFHPGDLDKMENFKDLRGKTFNVKLRMVGNSHAVSIPKEIVNFMNDFHKKARENMDDMVRLCFEDFGKLSLNFGDDKLKERRKWR